MWSFDGVKLSDGAEPIAFRHMERVCVTLINDTMMRHPIPASADSVPKGVAPPVPTDHAAEAFYDPAVIARARAVMLKEIGGMTFSQLMIDRLEYRA